MGHGDHYLDRDTSCRPLSKEVIFYTRIVPELAKLCPQMKSLLPDCYYGYSTKVNGMMATSRVTYTWCWCLPAPD